MLFDSLVDLTESFSSAVVAGTTTYATATLAKDSFNAASAKKRKEASLLAPVVAPHKMKIIDWMFG